MGWDSGLGLCCWCVTSVGFWSILDFSALPMLNLCCKQIPKQEECVCLLPWFSLSTKKQDTQKLHPCTKFLVDNTSFSAVPLALETGGNLVKADSSWASQVVGHTPNFWTNRADLLFARILSKSFGTHFLCCPRYPENWECCLQASLSISNAPHCSAPTLWWSGGVQALPLAYLIVCCGLPNRWIPFRAAFNHSASLLRVEIEFMKITLLFNSIFLS